MAKHTSEEAYFQRLKNLAQVSKTSIKESKNRTIGTLIDYKRAADGVAYGIIKENHHYYIKKGGLKSDPDAADFAYIGGLGNITEYQFGKLAEADKNRNMLLKTINEAVVTKVNPNGSKKKINLNEDKAAQEIGNAESMLGDLDAATAAEEMPAQEPSGEEMEAGLESEPADAPEGGEEMPAEMPAPEGGEEEMSAEMPAPEGGEGEDDAAADLEATLGGEEGGEEMPAPEGGEGEEEPVASEDPASETTRELEKQIGKITNTIRKTDLESNVSIGYLKSFIQAFKDKLPDIDIEERKKVAKLITNVIPPDEIADLGQNVEDSEKAAGIEPKLDTSEGQCAECGSFAKFAESRGYNSAEALMECGEEEVGNLVSGYANAHNDGMNDGDMENVALVIKVINPEILNQLKGDYGHEEYAEKLSPIVTGMNESSDEENIAKLNELFGGVNATNAPIDPASLETQPPIEPEFDDSEPENGETEVDAPLMEVEEEEIEADMGGEEEIAFAPAAQSLGGGVVKPEGAGTTVQVTKDSVNVTMNESERKLRKYIRARLQEKAGLRKPVLSEGKKSEAIKKLDASIDKQFSLYESMLAKKKVNEEKVNEVFGWTIKEKFAKLDPNNQQEVDKLFHEAYKNILTNPKMEQIGRLARKLSPEGKYALLKQYVEQGGGSLRVSGNTVVHVPQSVKDAATSSMFTQGGTQGKTQAGGV